MAKSHIGDFVTAAASNTDISNISTAEGWLPSTVNNALRALLSILSGFYDDISGQSTIGGTANAITITGNVPLPALAEGVIIAFQNSGGPNTGAVTLNVDGLGAKAIRYQGDFALIGGEMVDDGIYFLRYDASANAAAGAWILLNPRHYFGTTTNDSAGTGQIGEHISSAIAQGSAVSLTTNTPANVTSISLTAGDWDVSANVAFTLGATTSITVLIGSISQTSATLDATSGSIQTQRSAAFVPGAVNIQLGATGPIRVSLAATTTIYLVAQSTFTVSTNAAFGLLRARRIR